VLVGAEGVVGVGDAVGVVGGDPVGVVGSSAVRCLSVGHSVLALGR
jgi:hypothetical protein